MKYLLLGLLSCSYVTLTACQPRHTLPSLPNNAVTYETQMQFQSGLVHVDLSVNGANIQPFILDTGLPEMLLSPSQADLSGVIPQGETVQVTGVGQAVFTADVVNNLLVDLGGVQWATGAAIVLPPDLSGSLERNLGQPFWGVLGAQVFENYVVTVDFQREQLILQSAQGYRYEGAGEVLPLTFQNRKPYVEAWVQAQEDSEERKASFLIDLGSSQGLDLKHWQTLAAEVPVSTLPQRYASGLGGDELYRVGRIHQLRLGQQAISSPITSFETTVETQNSEIRGRIGTQILSQYRLIFNYPQKQLILEPASTAGLAMETDMSGLRLQWDSQRQPSIEVVAIYPNSPAAAVDIQVGDRILSVDNQSTLTLSEMKQLLQGQEGETRELFIQRDGQTLSRPIKLQRLI